MYEHVSSLHFILVLGLILVKTKFHTIALEHYLNRIQALIDRGITVGHLTGQSSGDELGLSSFQQTTILNEFRQGSIVCQQSDVKFIEYMY
jgi:hypothetical protein